MNDRSKNMYKHHNPCKPQLYKTEKYQYYRYPVKYICVPVEWDIKCEKHVCWEPVKPYPPVKVPCEQLKQFPCSPDPQYDKGYASDGALYEEDGYAQDDQEDFEAGGYAPGGESPE